MSKPKFKLHRKHTSPEYIDYDILGLFKKKTFVNGELITVEYYRNYDGGVYSDLVVKESRTYIRDPATGILSKREMIIEWYLEDNTVGLTKKTEKYYNIIDGYAEGRTVRRNIIDEASMYLYSMLGYVDAVDMLQTCSDNIDLYIAGDTNTLIDQVQTMTKTYLTTEIRNTVLSIINVP